jgi:PAP2 superfamily
LLPGHVIAVNPVVVDRHLRTARIGVRAHTSPVPLRGGFPRTRVTPPSISARDDRRELWLVPHSFALVDEWLSWPERMLGITHPVVYRTCEAWGLLLPMEFVYDSVWVQVVLILGWFGLVRRNVLPLWEVSAAVSISAAVGLVVFWLAPAIGPWAYYGQAAYGSPPPSAEAAFLADFAALREGRFTALLAGQGLVTIPSFHVVFAVLFAWVFRQERFLYPIAIVLNLGVIAVTFPVGWHYLADLPAGMVWVAATIAVVRRIQGAPAQSAADQEETLAPLQGVLGEGGTS